MRKRDIKNIAISGADGPTSIFILGGEHGKRTLKQKVYKMLYEHRKKRVMKSIKANPHSMEELIEYMKTKWGFSELSEDTLEYKLEYTEMRASFLIQYKPELLGDLAETPKLKNHSEEGVKAFIEQVKQQQKAATEVPKELFDIEFCVLELGEKEEGTTLSITLEKNYDYIGGSASGDKNVKLLDKIIRESYQYYGVSQEDIDNHTKRYEELVKTLARRF